MTKRVQGILLLTVAVAIVGLASCGKYNCATDDGLSFSGGTCSSSSPSSISSGGGTTGSTSAAFVFAVDTGAGSGNGTIDGYTLNTSANTLAATASYTAPTIPENDGGVGMVVAQKQFLYAGFATTDQIYAWTISSAGALTAITGSPFPAPFLSNFGAGVGQDNMITNPAGSMLFVSDTLQNKIYVYQIGSAGVLTAASGSPVSVPFPPMNLSTDGLGKYLYAIDGNFSTHTGTEIAAYVIGSSGSLTTVPGSPFVYPMWQVQGEPTGQFLIGTSGNSAYYSGTDDLHLYVFSIAQSGSNAGALTPVSGSPFTTVYSPFNIAVSPDTGGSYIYTFSFNDTATGFNPPEGYQISSSGTLTALSGSPFSGLTNGSWGQFDQSGDFLLDYGSYLDSTTGTTVSQLSPFDVGSGGALTQPISTLTLATQGFWVVTDPE
jgi:hypothetical protein